MKKYANDLAREYQLGDDPVDFFNYIVESLINGNRSQVKNLFNKMKPHSQYIFLAEFLDLTQGYHASALRICLKEVLNP